MSLGKSWSLFVFKKHFTCQHPFGCFERFVRTLIKTTTYWLFASTSFQFFTCYDLKQEFAQLFKDNNFGGDDASDAAYIGL